MAIWILGAEGKGVAVSYLNDAERDYCEKVAYRWRVDHCLGTMASPDPIGLLIAEERRKVRIAVQIKYDDNDSRPHERIVEIGAGTYIGLPNVTCVRLHSAGVYYGP